MSASLIAATTQALKAQFQAVMPASAVVTFQSLSQAEQFPPSPRVNLFLHRLGEAAGINASPQLARAPLHLELRYLITAYSPDDSPAETDPGVLLEAVLRTINLTPVITLPQTMTARLVLETLPLADLTGLFLSAQTAYRASLSLVVRVLDESPAPAGTLAVEQRRVPLKVKAKGR